MTTTKEQETVMPFDLYGDLEIAYEEAAKNGAAEITETLDAFGLWDDDNQVPAKFMLRAWRAINGDVAQQRELAWCFDWIGSKSKRRHDQRYDKPHLAVYWYEMAAKAGDVLAQNNLANIYCAERGELWNGRRGIYWYEKAAAQKLPSAMRGLARCLGCGRCRKDGADPIRARALLDEIAAIKQSNEETE